MPSNIAKEIATMQKLPTSDLRGRYAEVFGESTRVGNKTWVIKRIAWRLQAQEFRPRPWHFRPRRTHRTTQVSSNGAAAPASNWASAQESGNSIAPTPITAEAR